MSGWFASAVVVIAMGMGTPAFAGDDVRDDGDEAQTVVSANALGILEFGPSIVREIGRENGLSIRLRPGNLGILSYFVGFDNYYAWYDYGGGLAGGYRRYFSHEALRGVYVGGALEVDYTHWTSEDYDDFLGRDVRSGHVAISLIPTFETGYRWIFGRFVLGVGGVLAVVLPLTDDASFYVLPLPVVELGAAF